MPHGPAGIDRQSLVDGEDNRPLTLNLAVKQRITGRLGQRVLQRESLQGGHSRKFTEAAERAKLEA